MLSWRIHPAGPCPGRRGALDDGRAFDRSGGTCRGLCRSAAPFPSVSWCDRADTVAVSRADVELRFAWEPIATAGKVPIVQDATWSHRHRPSVSPWHRGTCGRKIVGDGIRRSPRTTRRVSRAPSFKPPPAGPGQNSWSSRLYRRQCHAAILEVRGRGTRQGQR